MATTPEAQRLTAEFNAAMTRVRMQTAAAVIAAWSQLDNYDDEQLDAFLNVIVPLVRGAQGLVTAAVDAYLARYVSLETGADVVPIGIDPNELFGRLRNGTPPEEVYRRPFVAVWSELKAGTPFEQAVQRGQQRLDATVQADVMLAHREAARDWMSQDDSIVGYQRVLSGVSCGLCAVASTQRYRVADLLPIHARCDCTVEPLIGTTGSRVIAPERLQRLREQLGPDYSDPKQLKRERVEEDGHTVQARELPEAEVREHGELGPVLVDARHRFTAPSDIAA